MPTKEINYAVQMQGISKYFGAFCALNNVSLDVKKGTVHALLGENGAGKSTLMNVLYGLYQAEKGTIAINDEPVSIKTPNDAIKLGIGMVHQHFMLVEPFTVVQNIILGYETTKAGGVLDIEKAKVDIQKLADKYDFKIDLDAKIEDISVGMQQKVEIIKALYRGVDILILDEPTAVLTPSEIDELINIMNRLVEDGKTIIVITHKLKEIKKSSQYCTIIRRGEYIDTVNVDDVTEDDLASMMVGRKVNLHVDTTEATPGEEYFRIENLVVQDSRGIDKVNKLNLSVRKGEILGIAGIDGNGQTQLVEAITCLTKAKEGKILVHGKEVQNTTPRHVMDSGVSTIHEDRHKRGLVLPMTVAENFVINSLHHEKVSHKGVLDLNFIKENAKNLIEKFDIRPLGCEQTRAAALSGGNQQKVIIAREVNKDPDVLIAVQPTRGLDVGAIEYVHKALIHQRDNGKAVLLISLELDEVMDVADRIAVIYDGKIVGEFEHGQASENDIGLLMAGGGEQ